MSLPAVTCRTCDSPVPMPARGATGRFCSKRCRKRHSKLQEKFGISIEAYRFLLAEQGYGCAVCGEECSTGRALCVDHDHDTDTIRGLLCLHCNMLIGFARDHPGVLDSAAAYLQKLFAV